MLKRIVGGIVTFVLLVLIGGVAYFAFTSPYKLYVVHTGSMGNTIPTRSAVIVHKGQYHAGQVVSFTIHGEVVTHRLMHISADGTIVTKGDANRSADPYQLTTSSIIGGVVAAPRELGFWLFFVKQPTGIPTIALALIFVWLLLSSGPKVETVEPVAASP